MTICDYCKAPRSSEETWHDCLEARVARKRLGDSLCAIDMMMRGGPELTDDPDKLADRDNLRTTAHIFDGSTTSYSHIEVLS